MAKIEVRMADVLRGRRRIAVAMCVSIVVSVGLGWFADGLGEYWFADGEMSGPAWTGLALVACGAVAVVVDASSSWNEVQRWKDLFLGVILLPAASGWMGDGVASSVPEQALVGAALVFVAGWLAVRGVTRGLSGSDDRPVAEHLRFSDEELRQARVLVASVGPLETYPKALLHTLRAMPNLQRVVSVDDGMKREDRGGLYGVLDHWNLLVKAGVREGELSIQHVKVDSNVPPTDLASIREKVREKVGDERAVVVDVTGGRVPQSLAVYDIARELGYSALYVVATEPSALAKRWRGEPARVTRRLVEASQRDAEDIGLKFTRLLHRKDEDE